MGRIVNRQELAEILGYSLPTISAWVEEGCPAVTRGGRGKSFEFDTVDVVKWLLARERQERKEIAAKSAKVKVADGGAEITIDVARLRHEVAKAKSAEIDLSAKIGQLAPVEMIAKVVSNEIANARARLLSIPVKMRPSFHLETGTAEGAKRLVNEAEKLIRDALTEIKSYGAEP